MNQIKVATPKKSTKFGAGNPGKPKGAVNKIHRDIKEMVMRALEGAGGVAYLIEKAETHPAAFLSLVGKVLPLQVTGENGERIQLELIQRVIVEPPLLK